MGILRIRAHICANTLNIYHANFLRGGGGAYPPTFSCVFRPSESGGGFTLPLPPPRILALPLDEGLKALKLPRVLP